MCLNNKAELNFLNLMVQAASLVESGTVSKNQKAARAYKGRWNKRIVVLKDIIKSEKARASK